MIDQYSPLTHNGTFTVVSSKTGDHRTFKIATPRKGKLAGKRVVSLLTGSDNERDYTSFGFVEPNGIRVWQRCPDMAPLARMLENLPHHVQRGSVTVTASVCCRVCNRKLTTPESLALGIGPSCATIPTVDRPLALTIKQPWAWAIIEGHKDCENRTWATDYRGPLLIHTSKKPDPDGFEFLDFMGVLPPENLALGGIVGQVQLVNCRMGYPSDWAMPDQYQWVLHSPTPLPFRPMRGQLGLWEVE